MAEKLSNNVKQMIRCNKRMGGDIVVELNKRQVFNNGAIKISNNVISYSAGIAQVSNISRVYVSKLPERSYKLGVVLIAVGVLLTLLSANTRVAGLLIFIVGIIISVYIYKKNEENRYGLFIKMNSGHNLIFPSNGTGFLYEAANFLANVIEGKVRAEGYTIVFNDNSIHDVSGAVVSGGNVERMLTYVKKSRDE